MKQGLKLAGVWLIFPLCVLLSSTLSAQIIASETEGCAPLIGVQFSHSFSGATGVNWDFGNGASSSGNNPSHTFQTPGTYTVTFTAAGGISETLTVSVLERPQAAFNVLGASGGCIPHTVQFEDASVPASGASLVSWSWDFGDGGVASGANPTPIHTYSLVGINEVVLVVQDNNGCTGSVSLPAAVTTSIPPDLTLNSTPESTSACNPPHSVDFSANASSNSPQGTALTYAWTFADGSTHATSDPPELSYDENGEYPLSVIVTDDTGCSASAASAVFIGSPQADLELLEGPNFCDTVYVVNHSDPATTSINWGTGSSMAVLPMQDTLMHVYGSPGDFDVTVTASSPGCQSTSTVSLTIDDASVSIVSSPNFTCFQELEVTYEAVSENGDVFYWTFEGDTNVYEGSPFVYTHVSPAAEDPYFQGGPDIYGAEVMMLTPAGCLGTASALNDTIWTPYAAYGIDLSDGCAPLTVAFADSSSAASEIVGWEWHFGDGNEVWLDNMEDPYEHTYTDHGDFEPYLVIHTEEGCTDTSFTVSVNVGIEGVPDVNFSQTSVCPGEEIDFEVFIPGGAFTPDFWTVETDNNQFSTCPGSPDFSGSFSSEAGFHDVNVVVIYNGCESSTLIEDAIEVKGPVGKLRAEMNCDDPFTVDFFAEISGADSWEFDFGDGNTASGGFVVSHTYGNPGDRQVVLTSSAGNGCPDFTDSLEVRIRDLQAELDGPADPICTDTEITLSAAGSQYVETYCNEGFLWLFDPAMNIPPYRTETPDIEIDPLPGGTYTVTMVAQDYNGCTDTAVALINVFDLNADFNLDFDSPCLPLEVNFLDASASDTTITDWSWTFSGGASSNLQNPNQSFNTSGNPTFNATLTVTDILGCESSTSQTFSADMPNAAFTGGPQQACTGEEINFNATNPGYPVYEWDFGNGETAATPAASTAYEEAGLYTVSLTTENNAGCRDSVFFNNFVNIQAVPDVGFSTNVDDIEHLCYPILIEFTDTTSASIFDYRDWDLGTGFPVVTNPTVGTIYETPGTYTVSLEVATTFGCVGYAEQDFVIQGPVADFSMSTDAVCLYDAVELSIVDSSDVAYFMWDFGNGQDSAMVDPVTYTYDIIPASGSTHIQLILWSSDSVCSATTQHPFALNRTIADFDRNLELTEEDSIHCFGIADQFTNYSIDATDYLWEFGNGAVSVQEDPLYNYPAGGDWDVTLYAMNANTGCSDTLTKPMTVFPKMVTGAENGLACIGDTIYLSAFGGETYEWSPPDVVANPSAAETFVFDSQSHELEVLITDTNDCSQLLSVVADYIFEPPRPAWSDTAVLYGDPVFIDYPPIPYHTFTWFGMNGGACPGCGTPGFHPTFDMSVGLLVTDEMGCYEAAFEFGIEVETELFFYMPNAFTPNGDGVNDLLHPVITQALPQGYKFSIWNRQGRLVWETDDINDKWRGNSAGSEHYADVEVYVYKVRVLDLRSDAHEFTGHVTLIR